MLNLTKLSAREMLTKARVMLNDIQPFYAYVTMRLDFIEEESIETIGVDQYGNCYYNAKWIEALPINELMGVLSHEVSHCLFDHLLRMKNKDAEMFNVSADIVINNMLGKNNFALPKCGIIPYNNQITISGYLVKDIDKKGAERIYDELMTARGKQKQQDGGTGNGTGQQEKGFDKHIVAKKNPNAKKGKSGGTGKSNKDYWQHVLVEAVTQAKMQGKVPNGMDRYFDALLHPELDWRQLLHKYITDSLPTDFTWLRPSKKSYSTGIYMPSVVKEGIELVVAIDTSGSVGTKELTKYISEVNGIVEKVNGVTITVIFHDTEVYGGSTLYNPTSSEVVDMIKKDVKGGGGTSHVPVFKWVEDNKPDTKLLICFTDGYTNYPKSSPINTITVIDKNGTDRHVPFGKVIKVD